MKKNIYYQTLFARPNGLKLWLLTFFLSFSFLFRIPIEVFVRKNFGERYFNLLISILIGVFLLYFPYYMSSNRSGTDYEYLTKWYGLWYVFTLAYCYCVFARYKEVVHEPSVFDFKRFSLSTGKVHPKFFGIKVNGRVNKRKIETLYEPAIFFIPGVILAFFEQPLGYFLVPCALIYSLGYVGAYYMGDNFIMDKIDEMICNEELRDVFVHDNESEKGFPFYGKKPSEKNTREKLYDSWMKDGDDVTDAK
jgi:hypothetical protein